MISNMICSWNIEKARFLFFSILYDTTNYVAIARMA